MSLVGMARLPAAAIVVVSLFGPLFAAAALDPCQPNDYVPKYGACSVDNVRRKSYQLRGNALCDGAAQVDFNETVACACVLDELDPVTTACDVATGMQNIVGYVPIETSNCTVPSSVSTQLRLGPAACSCGPADVGSAFTPCVNGTRSVVFYWKRACDVDADGQQLPSPQVGPCEVSCRGGQFLAPPYPICEKCPAGTMSFAGSRYLPPYKELPNEALTTCTTYNIIANTQSSDCKGWAVSPDNTFFHSGDNKNIDDMESTLSFAFDIVSYPASISFDFAVSSEPESDFFQVVLDGVALLDISGEHHWQEFVYEFPADADACFFSILDSCLETNQLLPYRAGSFFSTSNLGPFTFVDIKANPCLVDSYASVSMDAIAFVSDAGSICDVSTIIKAAQTRGLRGVVIGTDTPIRGGSQIVNNGFIVASMDTVSASALHVKMYETIPGNNRQTNTIPGVIVAPLSHDSTPGKRHHLTFTYWKDFSRTEGDDRAMVRNLKIKGSSFYATECEKCPYGQGSNAGAATCEACPTNSYANTLGTPLPCNACPAGQVAPPGSATCASSAPCSIDDYVVWRGPCRRVGWEARWEQNVSLTLAQPPVCNLTAAGGFVPAPLKTVNCGDCVAGEYRHGVDGHCAQCENYMITKNRDDTSGIPCVACWPGMVPQRALTYEHFDQMSAFPATWTRKCTHCLGQGWALTTTASMGGDEFGHTAISAGRGILGAGTAFLDIPVSTYLYFTVSVTYFATASAADVSAALANVRFDIMVRDTAAAMTTSTPSAYEVYYQDSLVLLPRQGFAVSTWTSVGLPPGNKTVSLRYRNVSPDQPAAVTVSIVSLGVTFERSGGGQRCVQCPDGYGCPQYAPFPLRCGPGSTSNADRTACNTCPLGQYSSMYANTQCYMCPAGFEPKASRDVCHLPSTAWAPESAIWMPVKYNITEDAMQPIRRMRTPLNKQPHDSFNVTHFANDIISFDFRTGRGAESTGKVFLSLFEPKTTLGTCTFTDGVPAFGCLKTGNNLALDQQVSLGSQLRAQVLHNGFNDSQGMLLTYDAGPCNEDPSKNMITSVQLMCDTRIFNHVVVGTPTVTTCQITLKLASRFACPMCNNQSIVYSDSACDRDTLTMNRVYSWADTRGNTLSVPECSGGVHLPATETLNCPWVTFELGKELNGTWAMIGVIIFLVLALVVLAIHLYLARKKLYQDYESLRTTIPREMDGTGAGTGPARRRGAVPPPSSGNDVIEIEDNDPLPIKPVSSAGAVVAPPNGAAPPAAPRDPSVPVSRPAPLAAASPTAAVGSAPRESRYIVSAPAARSPNGVSKGTADDDESTA